MKTGSKQKKEKFSFMMLRRINSNLWLKEVASSAIWSPVLPLPSMAMMISKRVFWHNFSEAPKRNSDKWAEADLDLMSISVSWVTLPQPNPKFFNKSTK